MNVNELIAIDVHTHAEVSCRQEPDEAWAPFEAASSKYFKAAKRPTIAETIALDTSSTGAKAGVSYARGERPTRVGRKPGGTSGNGGTVSLRRLATTAALVAGLCMSLGASAQLNLVGYWDPIFHEDFEERLPGPAIGDYLGLPISDAARWRAESWDASLLSLPEHQCKPHPSTYGFRGVGTLRIWEERDPATQELVKIHTHIQWQAQHREIWMDGRAHPPEYAQHTWQGFSTGHFEGDVLVVSTTHLKAGWMRRNGLPLSDRATMTDRFYRHGDVLTHVMIVEDPVYLTEPLVKTNGFLLAPNGTMTPYPCETVVEVVRPPGFVPNFLPGKNPFLAEFGIQHHLPVEATRGGAETALPEFAEKLK